MRLFTDSPFSFVLSVVFLVCFLFCFFLTKLTVLIKDDKNGRGEGPGMEEIENNVWV